MPVDENGTKWAWYVPPRPFIFRLPSPHWDRYMVRVRSPGRPLSQCPHDKKNCDCENLMVVMVARGLNEDSCECTRDITRPPLTVPFEMKQKMKKHSPGAQRGTKGKKKGGKCCPKPAEAQGENLNMQGNKQPIPGCVVAPREEVGQDMAHSEYQDASQEALLSTKMSENAPIVYGDLTARPPTTPSLGPPHQPATVYSSSESMDVFGWDGLPVTSQYSSFPAVLQGSYQSYDPSIPTADSYSQISNVQSSLPQHGHPASGQDGQQYPSATEFQYPTGQNMPPHGLLAQNNAGLLGVAASAAEDSNLGSNSATMHNCTCGSICNCIGCPSHPYNDATRQFVLTSATQISLDDLTSRHPELNQEDVDPSNSVTDPNFNAANYDTYFFSQQEAERYMNPETLQHAYSAGAFHE
ncbi:MAG: hypothetical protein Q9191_007322 [Dirinaria sp. TL-2023a]